MLASICCQKGDWEGNLSIHRDVLRQASSAQCVLAVFPEMSLTGSIDPLTNPEGSVGLRSEVVRLLVESTQRYSVAAVFGISERGDNGESYITQVYASHGKLLGVYRKRHLGEGEEAYTPGARSEVFDLGALRFGIAICAESEVDYPFDEPVAAGAQLILFCAAPGLKGRRNDEAGWRAGHEWWESRWASGCTAALQAKRVVDSIGHPSRRDCRRGLPRAGRPRLSERGGRIAARFLDRGDIGHGIASVDRSASSARGVPGARDGRVRRRPFGEVLQ